MLLVILPLFFQVATTDVQSPAAPATAAATNEQAKPPEPQVVCKMERVTGSRARKVEVCKTEAYDKNGERVRDTMDMYQRRVGGQALPGSPG